MKFKNCLFIGTCLGLFLKISLWAALPELTADEPIIFDHETQEMIAKGNARLVHDDFLFEAQEIRFIQPEATAVATGDVRFSKGDFRAVASEFKYDIETITVYSKAFRLGVYPNYLQGQAFQGRPDYVEIDKATFYYAEPDWTSLSYHASKIWGKPGGKMYSKHALFKIGFLPVFYFPYIAADTQKMPVSIEAEMGVNNRFGYYIRSKVMLQYTEPLRVGGLLDYYTKRGVLVGPAYDYSKREGDFSIESHFNGGFIKDQGAPNLDRLSRPIGKDRYFAELSHQQQFNEHFKVTSKVSAWSDSEVTHTFRPDFFEANQNPDSFAEAVFWQENYLLSAFTRFDPNNFQNIQQRLPEVDLDYLPTPIADSDIYQTFRVQGAHVYQKSPSGAFTTRRVGRLDGYYGLMRPYAINEWSKIVPVVGTRIIHYQPSSGSPALTHFAGEVGFDLELKAYGQWDYANRVWKIDGIRHVVRPVVKYRYIPVKNSGNTALAVIDASVFDTLMDPLELNYTRKIDPSNQKHIARLGLENGFYTRASDYGSRTLAYLNLYQDINIFQKANQNVVGDQYTFARFFPAHWISFNAYSRLTTQELTLREINTSTTIQDADIWSVSLGSSYLQTTDIHQYNISTSWHPTARYTLSGSWHFNANGGKLIYHRYTLTTLVGNSWKMNLGYERHENSNLESKDQFLVDFELLSF